ncbi:MAG: hypothetical protein JSV32_02000 [Dehalococcoidia bacterium]|nr:MAG: hypothetical protein JSV32_02000 [Dehalococcoidia bacterium]
MSHACKNCNTPLRAGEVLNQYCQLMWCPNEKCGIIQIVSISNHITNEEAQEIVRQNKKEVA